MKVGNTTDLTVGRYAGLEAFVCDSLGVESIELAIGILHSGIVNGNNSLVTYATPAWWVIEQLRAQYPYADFNRDHF
ncbi:hypothetical protein CC2G_014839 [Coprinopsis cinerea AmutBmut pab1-1]|nr:hypothetical protein CC2G_014839 [Coprinopsis cinerea AmutBmut pab1-1]